MLVDARNGVVEQTRRHLAVAGAAAGAARRPRGQQDGPGRLRRATFRRDRGRVRRATPPSFGIADVARRARVGARRRQRRRPVRPRRPGTPGPTLLEHLEAVPVGTRPAVRAAADARAGRHPAAGRRAPATTAGMPGRLASGVVRVGDEVVVLPCGRAQHGGRHRPRVDGSLESLDVAFAPQSVDAAAGRRHRHVPRRPHRGGRATRPRRRAGPVGHRRGSAAERPLRRADRVAAARSAPARCAPWSTTSCDQLGHRRRMEHRGAAPRRLWRSTTSAGSRIRLADAVAVEDYRDAAPHRRVPADRRRRTARTLAAGMADARPAATPARGI